VGKVLHYFDRVNAAIVQVEAGEIRVGDVLQFKGHTTDFRQRIERLELEHRPVEVARVGQQVGVHVSQRVREHDDVLKLQG
jgi:putative protease